MSRIARTAGPFLCFLMLAGVLAPGALAAITVVSVNLLENGDVGNLVGSDNTAESGALAGAPGYNVGYWNDKLQGTFSGSLLDSNGSTVSGLSVTLNGGGINNNWSLTQWPSGNDKKMMFGSMGNGVSVTGIPYASYDLVVYNLPDQLQFGAQSSSVTLTIGATSTTVNQSLVGLPTGFTTFDVAGNPGGTIAAGNFNTIIFKGLTASSLSFIGRGNGFQIAQAPTTTIMTGSVLIVR